MHAKPFSLLIKPTSADCNLRCAYCFYLKKKELYKESKIHRMSDEVLEIMISNYLSTNQPVYTFGWQGGEPTLMGLEFFEKVTALQEKYGKGKTISNSLQTNGTLLNDDFACHLARYNFLVGISIDGPAEVHDRFRTRADLSSSHGEVMRGLDCLKRNHVEFNVLTLVNQANAGRGRDIYRYLCDLKVNYHQYIPCVEFDWEGRPMPYAITGKQWGQFLCDVFDEWIKNDAYKVSIRLFDSILNHMIYGGYSVCHMAGNCCQYLVVEHNGDIYPCDFYVDEDKKLGNLMTDSWMDIQNSDKYHAFGRQKAEWHADCYKCEYLTYCSADCLKHRMYSGYAADNISWLCEGWKTFFSHALPHFRELAEDYIRHAFAGSSMPKGLTPKLFIDKDFGRNDPCYCGSGRKYKKCHGV
ncbi:MAG TPA: anaerobic sulfatase maturase [Clostridiales bacterium]|nr:anaerobic sulfatase maturase [Clostridiales bacterium]